MHPKFSEMAGPINIPEAQGLLAGELLGKAVVTVLCWRALLDVSDSSACPCSPLAATPFVPLEPLAAATGLCCLP